MVVWGGVSSTSFLHQEGLQQLSTSLASCWVPNTTLNSLWLFQHLYSLQHTYTNQHLLPSWVCGHAAIHSRTWICNRNSTTRAQGLASISSHCLICHFFCWLTQNPRLFPSLLFCSLSDNFFLKSPAVFPLVHFNSWILYWSSPD